MLELNKIYKGDYLEVIKNIDIKKYWFGYIKIIDILEKISKLWK